MLSDNKKAIYTCEKSYITSWYMYMQFQYDS